MYHAGGLKEMEWTFELLELEPKMFMRRFHEGDYSSDSEYATRQGCAQ